MANMDVTGSGYLILALLLQESARISTVQIDFT
jgi:hypothetical protein